jgi:hypothetical protein
MICRDAPRFNVPGFNVPRFGSTRMIKSAAALSVKTGKFGVYIMFAALGLFASGAPSAAQTFTTLLSFDGADGANSAAGLVRATDGNFYGTTSAGGPTAMALSSG